MKHLTKGQEKCAKIIDKIKEEWNGLAKDFYICYSVKELAYKVCYDLQEVYNDKAMDLFIQCKIVNDKFKILFEIENGVYFIFDIWWTKTMYGDSGLHIGNATLNGKCPNGYKDIEVVLEDNEEEE
jgi:hypothetical protein